MGNLSQSHNQRFHVNNQLLENGPVLMKSILHKGALNKKFVAVVDKAVIFNQ
jgi:hypothetical protein